MLGKGTTLRSKAKWMDISRVVTFPVCPPKSNIKSCREMKATQGETLFLCNRLEREGRLNNQDCKPLLTMVRDSLGFASRLVFTASALRLPRLGRPPDLFPPLGLLVWAAAGGGGDGGGNTRSGHGVTFAGAIISSGEFKTHLDTQLQGLFM